MNSEPANSLNLEQRFAAVQNQRGPKRARSLLRPRSGARLFNTQAAPLENGVTPLASVRAPKLPPRFWLALLCLVFAFPGFGTEEEQQNSDSVLTNTAASHLGEEDAPDLQDLPDHEAIPPAPEPAEEVVEDDSTSELIDPSASTNAPTHPQPPPAPAPTVGPTPSSRRETEPPQRVPRPSPVPSASAGGAPIAPDLAAFKIISERNIFDPNRGPRRSAAPPVRTRSRNVESFSLVGTMAYEKGTFAFFDGSSSQFRKALKTSDTIAGMKVTSIEPNLVRLASGTKELEVKVGAQISREDEGEWRVTGRTQDYASRNNGSSTGSGAATRPAATSSPGSDEENEILKRLMQRREQE